MFRCSKCREVIGPCISPHVVPTGFRKDTRRGERLSEVQLCSVCHVGYKDAKDRIAEALDGYHFIYLNGTKR